MTAIRETVKATPETLNDVMEFDTVIYSHGDGTTVDVLSGIYAPSLFEGELNSSEWSLMDGYSGQHGYSGPVMHDSEYIGGRMARDILETAGYYVAVVSYYAPEEEDGEMPIEGWAVAYRETLANESRED